MKTNQQQKNTSKNWQLRKLDSMFSVRRGGSPRPIESYITNRDDGLNWLKIGDIDVGAKYITGTSSKILKEGLSRTTLVKKGDFILSNSMSFGRPYIMNIDACIHDGWLTFQDIKTDILDRDFLYYLLSQSKTQSIFASISAGSGVLNLKKETVAEVELSIPPLSEQNRIVSVLETWEKSVEKLAKKIELKKQIKKGLMQDLLTGRKRLKGFSDKWEIILLGNICKIRTGKKDVNQGNSEGVYPFFTCAKQHTYSDSYSFDTEAILIAGNGEVGNCQYYKGKFEAYQRTYVLNEFTKDVQYLFAYLNYFFQNTINSQKQMGAMPYIKLGMLQDYEIRIPKSREEQLAIAQILTTADKEIKRLENKLKILKEQKRYLLNNLITGTIRTPETLSAKLTK